MLACEVMADDDDENEVEDIADERGAPSKEAATRAVGCPGPGGA